MRSQICPGPCGKEKSIIEFPHNRRICHECVKQQRRERRVRKPKILKPTPTSKVCIGPCNKERPITEFSTYTVTLKDGSKSVRHKSLCKDCNKIRAREWWRKNSERLNKEARLRYHGNRPKRLTQRRNLYRMIDILLKAINLLNNGEELPEDIKIHIKEEEWRAQNRARIRDHKKAERKKENDRKWAIDNKERRTVERRERKRNATNEEKRIEKEKREAYLLKRPEVVEEMRLRSKRSKADLEDSYVVSLIRYGKERLLKKEDIPDELIDLKRKTLMNKRKLKSQNVRN